MRNKFFAVLLCLVLVVCMSVALTSCNKGADAQPTSILYLGDSIAEAVAGPSPIQDRVNYGYYGILGQINNLKYDNRSVSGYQTKNLLDYLRRDSEDANLVNTLVKQADIIHISILGNDLLQYNYATMLLELAAQEKFGDDYVSNAAVQNFYIYRNGSLIQAAEGDENADENGLKRTAPGDGLRIFNACLAAALQNISDIVSLIKTANPDVTLIFQNVYNPIDGEAELVSDELKADLLSIDAKYDTSTASGVQALRDLGGVMIGGLDNVLNTYLSTHKGAFHVIDAYTAFDNVYKADMQRGMDLIHTDGVHPSDEGHAVLAGLTQDLLASLGLADSNALNNYKSLRTAMLDRMYSGVSNGTKTFDLSAAKSAINEATTFDKVSEVYFDSVDGYTPKLYSHATQGRVTNGKAVSQDTTYLLSGLSMNNLAQTADSNDAINSVAKLVIEKMLDKRDLVLKPDGTMTITVTANISNLLGLLTDTGGTIDNMIIGGEEDAIILTDPVTGSERVGLKAMGNASMVDLVKTYITKMFPGVGVDEGTVGDDFHLLNDSMGLQILGDNMHVLLSDDYVDADGLPDGTAKGKTYGSYVDYLLAYLSVSAPVTCTDIDGNPVTYHVNRLPDGITAKLQSLGTISIQYTGVYSLTTVTGADGTQYEAIYCGQYLENASPWLIMTKFNDKKGVAHVKATFEIMGITLTF